MGEVIWPTNLVTRLDLPPERVLASAAGAGLKQVVVIGYTEGGEEYAATSISDAGTVTWLLERTKKRLLDAADE